MNVAGAGVALHARIRVLRLAARLGPALGLGLRRGRRPLGHLLLELGLRGFEVCLLLLPLFVEHLEDGMRGELVALHPRLGGAAAPSIVDEADRHAERLVQLPPEEIADGRELADRFRRAGLPRALEVPLRFLNTNLRHRDEADVRKLRGGFLEVGIVRLVHAPLHVRLAGADPDLADEHVIERDRVLPLHRERVRAAVLHDWVEQHVPCAVWTRRRGLRLPTERHGDGLAGIGLAPDFVVDALLDDHVVAEHVVERHVGLHGGGGERQDDAGDRGRPGRHGGMQAARHRRALQQ